MLDDLKQRIRSDPFVPFRMVLTGGTSYDVTNRFQIAIGSTQLSYYFANSDRKAVVRQNQIAAFETLDTAA